MRNVFTLPTIAIFLTVATFTVEGFSISSRTAVLPRPSPLLPRRHQSSPSSSILTRRTLSSLVLNQDNCIHDDSAVECKTINLCSQMVQKGMKKFQRKIKRTTNQCTAQVVRFSMKSRRTLLALCAVMLFWLGAAGTYTPASHGTSVSPSAPVGEISRNHILSSSLDEIIDEYVKDHMFDDDAYDPVESIYREAIDDKLKGTYPKDLKETASSVLGQNVMKAEKKSIWGWF